MDCRSDSCHLVSSRGSRETPWVVGCLLGVWVSSKVVGSGVVAGVLPAEPDPELELPSDPKLPKEPKASDPKPALAPKLPDEPPVASVAAALGSSLG